MSPKRNPRKSHSFAYDALESVFGNEWHQLNASDQNLVARDFNDAVIDEGISSSEYLRRIGRGNLQSYAKVMRVRAKQGWNKNARRAKRNPVSAALAVLKAAEAAHYMKKNPQQRDVKRARKIMRKRWGKSASDPRRGFRITMRDLKKRARKGFRVNPASKQIRLQEKRGAEWVTLALFPLTQKAFAVKMAKLCHRKHPGKTLRLVS